MKAIYTIYLYELTKYKSTASAAVFSNYDSNSLVMGGENFENG